MNFPTTLQAALSASTDNVNTTTAVRDCNGLVEQVFVSFAGVKPDDVDTNSITPESLRKLAKDLSMTMLRLLAPGATAHDDGNSMENETERIKALSSAVLQTVQNESGWLDHNDTLLSDLAELLRATKNLLRWYIQIYLSVHAPVLPSPLSMLQSTQAVDLYVTILQRTSASPERQETARHACLALFYATYNPLPQTSSAMTFVEPLYQHLVESLDIVRICITLLMENNAASVLLSVVRLLHNLLGSVPGLAKRVSTNSKNSNGTVVALYPVPKDDEGKRGPWMDDSIADNTNDQDGTASDDGIDTVSLLFRLMAWHIQPPFPNERRSDLVVEILRTLYVLRAGLTLGQTYNRKVLLDVLSMDEAAFDCKLGCVTLLMDAPQGFGKALLSADNDNDDKKNNNATDSRSSTSRSSASSPVVKELLSIMEIQVSDVVKSSRCGNTVATALVPSLVVLNRFSQDSPLVLQQVREAIFPPSAEVAFQEKAAAETAKVNGQGVGAKNMSPLDAPRDSLRWKLIRLMTWTESHTKRVVSELLWTLCHGDAKEFVLRTGFGNAMPMLGLKGLVEMPSQFGK